MKPIFLEISGWGPYKDCEKIDFKNFGNKGIFLITGPTGAGKTTIFDAICFALYGKVSGNLRGKESLRSDFAKDTTKTYVEMIFMHMDKEYKIRRNPKYKKAKLRGSGTTDENESAVLYYNEQVLAEGITNVNAKVRELLGLEYEQFKQIAMIAQGEFQKLLTADSQERTKIFRSIFSTQLYEKMQELLKVQTLDLKKQLEDLKSKADEAVNLADIEDEQWKELTEVKSINYKKIVEYLEERKNILKEKEKEYSKKQEETDKKIQELINITNQKKQLEKNYEQYDAECTILAGLKEKEKDIDGLKIKLNKINQAKELKVHFSKYEIASENLKKAEEEITSLTEEYNQKIQKFQVINEEYSKKEELEKTEKEVSDYISLLENQFEIYSQYTTVKNEYVIQSKELETVKEEIYKNQEIVDKAQLQIEECNKHLEEIEAFQKTMLEEKNRILKLEVILEDINNYKNKNKDLAGLKDKYNKELKEYNILEENYVRLQKEYADIDSLYRKAAAGILAGELKENEPCPVCGSVEHPKKAVLCKEASSKEEVDKAKDMAQEAREKAEIKAKELAGFRGRMDSVEEEQAELLKKIQVNNQEEIEELFIEKSAQREKSLEIIEKAQDIISKKASYEEYRQKAEKGKEEYTDKLNKEKDKQETLNNVVQNLFGKEETLKKSLKVEFENIEGYEREIAEQKDKRKNLKDSYEKLLAEHKEMSTEIERIKGILDNNRVKYENSKKETDNLQQEFEKAYLEKGFISIEEYKIYSNAKEEEITEEIQEYKDSIIAVNSNIDKIKKDINNEPRPDIQVYIQQSEEVNREKSILLKEKDQILIFYSNTKKCLEALKDKLKRLEVSEKEYGKISQLNAVTSGNNPQKLMFEQYVLSKYFDDILASANIRLAKMTEGRYELFRVKGVMDARTKNALDIEVLDNYTGKVRHVNTLSGGESFKAALALAFGTSDIMQNNAGGIEADILFIDEGFGSLDSESLQQAINILSSMAGGNRLIGIISHVGELKEQISRQIVIEKTSTGSRITCQNL